MAKVPDLLDYDRSNMRAVLRTFPEQVRHALEIAQQTPSLGHVSPEAEILIAGLGGSAIGADLVRSYCAATRGADRVRISVWRGYGVPSTVDQRTIFIASSYSGDTEETLSAYDAARKRTSHLLCITTGGKLAARAQRHRVPCIIIPAGFQPRCALGYSFFPLLMTVLSHAGVDDSARRATMRALPETLQVLEELSQQCAEPLATNPAYALARTLHGRCVVLYSSYERTDAVALRWRGQIQENAKQLAFSHVLPEMNHNEINGWQFPRDIIKQTAVILLRDRDDHRRVALRFQALEEILRVHNVKKIHTVQGKGSSLLARMMSLVYLGDWTSYYLALLNGVDPTPVPVISQLKQILATAR